MKLALKLLVIASVVVGGASAADNPFVGQWKMNPAKSRMPDEMKVESQGGNKFLFNFGGGGETIVVDGSYQPGGYGGTLLSVAAETPDTWIVQRKKDGQLLIKATWKLSKDGSTLTDYFREFESDGSTLSMDYIYQRTGGGSGFAGDWQSSKETLNARFTLEVMSYEGDGLSFVSPMASLISPLEQTTQNVKLDGKEHPDQGPKAYPNSSYSIRRVDDHTLEMTDKVGKIVIDTQQIRVSPDGKSLTMTILARHRSKPEVLVFERE